MKAPPGACWSAACNVHRPRDTVLDRRKGRQNHGFLTTGPETGPPGPPAAIPIPKISVDGIAQPDYTRAHEPHEHGRLELNAQTRGGVRCHIRKLS
jgi:hypothetical protein